MSRDKPKRNGASKLKQQKVVRSPSPHSSSSSSVESDDEYVPDVPQKKKKVIRRGKNSKAARLDVPERSSSSSSVESDDEYVPDVPQKKKKVTRRGKNSKAARLHVPERKKSEITLHYEKVPKSPVVPKLTIETGITQEVNIEVECEKKCESGMETHTKKTFVLWVEEPLEIVFDELAEFWGCRSEDIDMTFKMAFGQKHHVYKVERSMTLESLGFRTFSLKKAYFKAVCKMVNVKLSVVLPHRLTPLETVVTKDTTVSEVKKMVWNYLREEGRVEVPDVEHIILGKDQQEELSNDLSIAQLGFVEKNWLMCSYRYR